MVERLRAGGFRRVELALQSVTMWVTFGAYTGQAAGLATSVLWTGTSLLFTAASRRIGVTAVNTFRIGLAIALLATTHRLLFGSWLPELLPRQVLYLALSGVVGLAIGDQALFTAFVHIGPRLSMLIMTTAPLFAALFGWVTLGETLHGWSWLGIAMTIGGVAWVVLERPAGSVPSDGGHRLRGVALAFAGAACQAAGLWLSKEGMGHGWLPEAERLAPQAATLTRMIFAAVGLVPIVILHFRREAKRRRAGLVPPGPKSWRAGLLFATGGAVCGPFLGVWMSLVASDRAPLGVAQTLCSLPPVFILPFAVLLHKERIGPRAVVGAVVAVSGCAVLFLQPQ